MCYSAQVVQSLRAVLRRLDIRMDYGEAIRLFMQRLDDPGITISRAFEANFDSPQNEPERQIRELIQEHRRRMTLQWESDLFKQKSRLVAAERKLKEKITKTAQNEVRIATGKIDSFTERLAALRRIEPVADDARIFPMYYTGVVIRSDDHYLLTPMRYHCRPAGKPASYDRQFPGLYNARRDNLEAFWSGQFGKTHALAIMECFFENVKVHDLQHRVLGAGEKEQNVVLQFSPRPANDLLVACIWSQWRDPKEPYLRSFAVITDDPPPEVAAAGHNRCPVNLRAENIERWLTPQGRSSAELQAILGDRQQPFYEHAVMAA